MPERDARAYQKNASSGVNSWLESYGSLDDADDKTPDDLTMTFVDLVMLSLLDSFPMTGYALRKLLVSQFGLKTSYGTLYPRLKSLQKSGIIKYSEVAGVLAARRSGISYELTPSGKKVLNSNLRLFQEFLKRIQLSAPVSGQRNEF
jgi:DNA-binding PadR family transcriptional regulator